MKKFIGILACALLLMAAGTHEAKAKEVHDPPGCELIVGYEIDVPQVITFDMPAIQFEAAGVILPAHACDAEVIETKTILSTPVIYLKQGRCCGYLNAAGNYSSPLTGPPIFHRDRLVS